MTSDSIFQKSLKNTNGKVTRKLTHRERERLNPTVKLKGDMSSKDEGLGNGEPSFEPMEVSPTTTEVVDDAHKEVKKPFKGQKQATKGYVKGHLQGEA